jgi:NAD dependent epimerase/dehydratase family enzyme
VLSRDGGAYPPLANLARHFFGGVAGSGQQGFSWVHENDAIRALMQAVQRTDFTGACNVCAPEPAINADFMRALRQSIGRPWAPPAPAFAVCLVARHLMKIDPQLILGGRACAPTRLLTQGFQFEFPELAGALRDLARW